jgi:hypothetical protein
VSRSAFSVRQGSETSMHYFSFSGGTGMDSTKCVPGGVREPFIKFQHASYYSSLLLPVEHSLDMFHHWFLLSSPHEHSLLPDITGHRRTCLSRTRNRHGQTCLSLEPLVTGSAPFQAIIARSLSSSPTLSTHYFSSSGVKSALRHVMLNLYF